ncbi:MAG: TlpA family protein disulfide reductase [Chloracidobacterium sp.]|nr:TlpA family protein disulfide reductase [Chloracidobacterium sp.]
MREYFKVLLLFVGFSVVFSTLTACDGMQAGNANLANGASKGNSSKSGNYPPVVSGIAEGAIHLLDGTKTKLSDHKGKVVILNLWGIWCGPCRDEMPHLQAIQKQYADQGLQVMGLNVGDHEGKAEPVENIKRFAEQMKIDYTLARVESPMINQFYLLSKQNSVPQTIIVDREGRLRGLFVGGGPRVYSEMKSAVEKTMNE